MVDRDRVLACLAELDGYLEELRTLLPENREQYNRSERKRACERLLQISIETVTTICHVLVAGLKLGMPAEQDDVFAKLNASGVVSPGLRQTLQRMKGFRNILVHEYGHIEDDLVFEFLTRRLRDFADFQAEVRSFLSRSA